MPPIKRAAVKVHHGFDVKHISTDAVNDGVRKTVEVELAVFATDFAPLFGCIKDAAQGAIEFIEKFLAKA